MYTTIESNKAIRYELNDDQDGWRLSVALPRRVSGSDRITVLNWLQEYQGRVKSERPHWMTALRVNECGYTLYIRKAERPGDVLRACNLISQGDVIRDCWSGAVNHVR